MSATVPKNICYRGDGDDLDGTMASLRAEMVPVLQRLPAYSRLAWALIKEPRIGRRKAILVGGVAYLLSPIDLVPGVIPGLGQLDDLAVVLFALKAALGGLPQELSKSHLTAVGLTSEVLDEDLGRIGRSARLLAAAGLRFGGRVALAAGRQLWQIGARALRGGGKRRTALPGARRAE